VPELRVGILVGSESDRERMQSALDVLDEHGVGYEFEVRSAHRTPDAVAEYAPDCRPRCPASLRRTPICR
jgi:5-(carboxyamino)imidazole ribonucleotide mutase